METDEEMKEDVDTEEKEMKEDIDKAEKEMKEAVDKVEKEMENINEEVSAINIESPGQVENVPSTPKKNKTTKMWCDYSPSNGSSKPSNTNAQSDEELSSSL